MKNKLMLSVLSLILLNLTVSTFAANQVLQGFSKSDMEAMEQLKQEISNKHVYEMDFSLVSSKFASKTYMDVLNTVKETVKKYANFKEILETSAGATITSHCGPNTIGILYLNDGEQNGHN